MGVKGESEKVGLKHFFFSIKHIHNVFLFDMFYVLGTVLRTVQ